ncbi:MAG: hypothetical protein H2041_01240 [Phenylobacterium sp.]|uniref:hypothetical protein n=1 Tax=Phenylobacterium sp. TaxID=1871053 RepID=UPI0017B50EBE|nr:hypothetical protein [Phenylobacterium sp.]MBA4792270.1 hypothetical protein [Phenylobacterium sp.]
MRTIGYCRQRGLRLQAGCNGCRARIEVPLSAVCRAFNGWTVEELQRAGHFDCPTCGRPRGVSVMGQLWGHETDLECWTDGACHYRPPRTDGLSA